MIKVGTGFNYCNPDEIAAIFDATDFNYQQIKKFTIIDLSKEKKVLAIIIMKAGFAILCPYKVDTIFKENKRKSF